MISSIRKNNSDKTREIQMSKHFSETINLAAQTIPFLAITASFIIIAYTYGHTLTPTTTENPFDTSKIDFSHYL